MSLFVSFFRKLLRPQRPLVLVAAGVTILRQTRTTYVAPAKQEDVSVEDEIVETHVTRQQLRLLLCAQQEEKGESGSLAAAISNSVALALESLNQQLVHRWPCAVPGNPAQIHVTSCGT
jgi:hypothetical protein